MRNITRNNNVVAQPSHLESLTLRFTYFTTPSDTPREPTTTTSADSTNTSTSVRNCSTRLSFSKLRWWKAGAMWTCYLSVICCAKRKVHARESTDRTWEVEQPASERSISLIRSEDRRLLNVRRYSGRKLRVYRGTLGISILAKYIGIRYATFTSRVEGPKARLFLFTCVVSSEKLSARVFDNTHFSCHSCVATDRENGGGSPRWRTSPIKFKTRERNTDRRLGKRDKNISSANYQKCRHVGFSYERASPHIESPRFSLLAPFIRRRESWRNGRACGDAGTRSLS